MLVVWNPQFVDGPFPCHLIEAPIVGSAKSRVGAAVQ
jgi:hypothetical protein